MIIYPQIQQREGMFQPQFYANQTKPTTEDFVASYLQKLKQRPAVPALNPSSRVQDISQQIADPSNFQSFYKQLSTIKDIGREQVARSQAEAAMARIKAEQARAASIPRPGSPTLGQPTSRNVGSATGTVPNNPRENFKFAQQLASQFGWGDSGQLGAWYQLGMKESGWNNMAQNPTSTAFGIGQFLNSTWGGVGIGKTTDPYLQTLAMAKYIKNRYGSPSAALAFHLRNNWY